MALQLMEENIDSPEFPIILQQFLVAYPLAIQITIDGNTIYQSPTLNLNMFRGIETEDYTTARSYMITDVQKLVRSAAVLNLFIEFIVGIFLFIVVIQIDLDFEKKVSSPFNVLFSKILRIARLMKVATTSNLEKEDPYRYYMNVMTKMKLKAFEFKE